MSIITNTEFEFLKDVANNNNREWFAEHKPRYQASYDQVKRFFGAMEEHMNSHDSIAKTKVYRIYRDVRFSKDKTPYKTSFSGGFSRDTDRLRGGYYVHIEPGNSMLGGGFWGPNSEDLKLIRSHIAADDTTLRKILKNKKFKEIWGDLQGQQLKTAPKSYPKDHPAIDLLRFKQFIVSKHLSDKEVVHADFAKHASDYFKLLRPYFDYMSDILTHDLNGVSLLAD